MKIKHLKQLILASTSEIRKKMLEQVGLDFEVIKPQVDEDSLKQTLLGLPSLEIAQSLARHKSQSISSLHPDAVIIGADQVCVCEDRVFDKPVTREKALEHLAFLKGKTHTQNNAVSLYLADQEIYSYLATAELVMRDLSLAEMEFYIDLERPFASCGAYKFESYGKHLFSDVRGDTDCIQGLSILPLLSFLHKEKFIELSCCYV